MDRPVNPVATVLLVLFVAVLTIATAGGEADVTVEDFRAAAFTDSVGTTLQYRLFVPPDYQSGARYPLVTFLHGNGSQGSDNRRQVREGALLWAEPANQERHPAFVLAPQCPAGDGWGRPTGLTGYPAGSPLDALFELLDDIERRFPIDLDRLYITGMSGGGHGTLRALARQPERFAAAILVCPAGAVEARPELPSRERGVEVVAGLERVPLWFFHGTVDPVVPIALTRERVAALRRAGGAPRLTEYPNVKHDAWVKAYAEPEILGWLFSHRRAKAPAPASER